MNNSRIIVLLKVLKVAFQILRLSFTAMINNTSFKIKVNTKQDFENNKAL